MKSCACYGKLRKLISKSQEYKILNIFVLKFPICFSCKSTKENVTNFKSI